MSGTLVKSEPRAVGTLFRRTPLSTLREEMRDLFSQFMSEGTDGWLSMPVVPSVDLSETDQAIQARMDIPGMKPEEIDIQVDGNVLTVSGERKEEKEEKGRTFLRVERKTGSFCRTMTLPCSVKEDKVDAQYKDGVLTISMPKTDEAKSRRIKVKT